LDTYGNALSGPHSVFRCKWKWEKKSLFPLAITWAWLHPRYTFASSQNTFRIAIRCITSPDNVHSQLNMLSTIEAIRESSIPVPQKSYRYISFYQLYPYFHSTYQDVFYHCWYLAPQGKTSNPGYTS